MRRRFRQLVWVLLPLVAAGCECLFGARGLPADPLFAQRKPVESKSISGPPRDMPVSPPAPPINPYGADPRFTSAK
jgi:hypothetical protein